MVPDRPSNRLQTLVTEREPVLNSSVKRNSANLWGGERRRALWLEQDQFQQICRYDNTIFTPDPLDHRNHMPALVLVVDLELIISLCTALSEPEVGFLASERGRCTSNSL